MKNAFIVAIVVVCCSCGYGDDMSTVDKFYEEMRTSRNATTEARAFDALRDYIKERGLSVEIHVVDNDGRLSDEFENIQPADVAAIQLVIASPDSGNSRTLQWKPHDLDLPFMLFRE